MILWPVIIVVSGFVLFALSVYFLQHGMVFYPSKNIAVTPDQLGLEFEEVFIEVSGGDRIQGWYFPATISDSSNESRTVLFCHGNAGNISHRLSTVELILKTGGAVFLFGYRGYGQSTGKPDEENVYADAKVAYEWLLANKVQSPDKIVLFGRSLGGAVAIDLAARVDCAGLIVESSFSSAAAMGKRMFPWLPMRLLLRYQFDSVSKIGRVGCPVMVAHSPTDEIIPYEFGLTLFEAAKEPKLFVELSGGHNDMSYFGQESYNRALEQFIAPVRAN